MREMLDTIITIINGVDGYEGLAAGITVAGLISLIGMFCS